MISFSQVKASRAVQVAASCSSSGEFASLVNDACRRLLRRGDWYNTVVPVYVCAYAGCIVWPRYVAQVRKINICNTSIPVHNAWYEFLPANLGYGALQAYCGVETGVIQAGISPVLQDVMGEGRVIRAYARCATDYGKTMRIYGTDNYGQPLQTDNGDGTFSPGIVITLAAPFATHATYVRHIDYVVRQATQCIVDVYAYDAATNLLEEIAHYEPTETEPQYVRQRLTNGWMGCNTGNVVPGCCGARGGVLAMVKLRHVDAVADTDLLVMDNLDAIKLEIMSIKAEESGEFKEKQQWEIAAIEVLNRDLEINSPDEEFSAANNTMGPWVRSNQCR